MGRNAQQEIAGFVIIVVLVTVAIFIFIVFNLTKDKQNLKSMEVENLLNSLLKQTTDCVIREPIPANVGDLIESSYGQMPSLCKGTNKNTREYLREYLDRTMSLVLRYETGFDSYIIEIADSETKEFLDSFSYGNCTGKVVRGADSIIRKTQIFLRVC